MSIDTKNFQLSRREVTHTNVVDYFKRGCENPREVWLLLHGYQEKSRTIVKRLKPIIPDDVIVLAPNAPYPLPQKIQSAEALRFAWYFYDNAKDEYYIDYKVSSSLLKNLFEKLELTDLPLRIIGYSQGGYLAPFVGQVLANTIQVIGINCSIRVDYLPQKLNFSIDQVHAQNDEFVDPVVAKQRFDKLIEQGNKGSFTILPNETHFLSLSYLDTIKGLCEA